MKRLAFCLLALAGCAAIPNEPRGVRLINETLTVTFNDGAKCTVNIATQKSGRLPDCPEVMDYDVTGFRPSIFSGSVLGQFFESYATIRLTRPSDGREWTWKTPPDDSKDGSWRDDSDLP